MHSITIDDATFDKLEAIRKERGLRSISATVKDLAEKA
jgi:predicted CopG family antitoxin